MCIGLIRAEPGRQLVVRANVKVTPTTQDAERAPFTGTIAQVAGDLWAVVDAGLTNSSSTFRPTPGQVTIRVGCSARCYSGVT